MPQDARALPVLGPLRRGRHRRRHGRRPGRDRGGPAGGQDPGRRVLCTAWAAWAPPGPSPSTTTATASGFTATVAGGASWVIEQKMEWWRTELLEAGADIWFGTIGCGAFVDGERATRDGRRGRHAPRPRRRAGRRGHRRHRQRRHRRGRRRPSASTPTSRSSPCRAPACRRGSSAPPTPTPTSPITDETDMVDVWHLFVYAKDKYRDAFDLGQLIDTRERRRIVGDFTITILDQIAGAHLPRHDRQAVHQLRHARLHRRSLPAACGTRCARSSRSYIPYRCLLPKGLDGSCRDRARAQRPPRRPADRPHAARHPEPGLRRRAWPRPWPPEADGDPRRSTSARLQQHLVEIGNLPESVLTDTDSYPAAGASASPRPSSIWSTTIAAWPSSWAIADTSLPLLKQAYRRPRARRSSPMPRCWG